MRNVNPFLAFAEPGHFYSPLPDLAFVTAQRHRIFDRSVTAIPGIDTNTAAQFRLLEQFAPYGADLPFPDDPAPPLRYHYLNDFFSYGDAIVLFMMMRLFRPQRVIEVGSGYSSAAMLDTDALFLGNSVHFTFIEPYPDRLFSLLTNRDRTRHQVIVDIVQSVPVDCFSSLQAGDILFIDSSHVAKVGSDVVYLLGNVLPVLADGVIIHVHDVFWPFEYPEEWIQEGRAWNENYMLKAFLQFNQRFRILFFNSYLALHHTELVARSLPLFMKNAGGSLWLQKVAETGRPTAT